MRIIFLFLWGLVLFFPQLIIHFRIFNFDLGLGFITILVIYAGFTYPFTRGVIATILLGFLYETFSSVSHGHFILTYLILFLVIALIADRIFAEAYLTKSLWVFFFSMIAQPLFELVWLQNFSFVFNGTFWIDAGLQSLINGIVSFPLFIYLDKTLTKWMYLFARRRASITEADFYQIKSKQRKYL